MLQSWDMNGNIYIHKYIYVAELDTKKNLSMCRMKFELKVVVEGACVMTDWSISHHAVCHTYGGVGAVSGTHHQCRVLDCWLM